MHSVQSCWIIWMRWRLVLSALFSPFCSFWTFLFHSFLQAWAVIVQRDGHQVLLFVSLIHSIPNVFFFSVCLFLSLHQTTTCTRQLFYVVHFFSFSCWSEVLPLQPGVGQNIAMHATPTASSFSFLVSIFLVHSTSFFPNPFYMFSF